MFILGSTFTSWGAGDALSPSVSTRATLSGGHTSVDCIAHLPTRHHLPLYSPTHPSTHSLIREPAGQPASRFQPPFQPAPCTTEGQTVEYSPEGLTGSLAGSLGAPHSSLTLGRYQGPGHQPGSHRTLLWGVGCYRDSSLCDRLTFTQLTGTDAYI